jgi:hypothetical protein
MTELILKRASALAPARPVERRGDYDVIADGEVVGRIFLSAKSPVGTGGSLADARLRGDARGCDGCVRPELAQRIGPP